MSEQNEETSMIGEALPIEAPGKKMVYADSTIKAKEDLKQLDATRPPEESGAAVALTPREQLRLQVWQSAHFAASNAMLEASDRGDAEDVEFGYKVMDLCREQLDRTYKKIATEKGR